MSLLTSIRNLRNEQQTLVLDSTDITQLKVKEASYFHELGVALGINGSLRKDADLVQAIKNAIANEPNYFGVKQLSNYLIDGLAEKGSLKSSDLKSMVDRLDEQARPNMVKKYLINKIYTALPKNLCIEIENMPKKSQNEFLAHIEQRVNKYQNEHNGALPIENFNDFVAQLTENISARIIGTNYTIFEGSFKENFLKMVFNDKIPLKELEKIQDYLFQLKENPDISEDNKKIISLALLCEHPEENKLQAISREEFDLFIKNGIAQKKIDDFVGQARIDLINILEELGKYLMEDENKAVIESVLHKLRRALTDSLVFEDNLDGKNFEDIFKGVKKDFQQVLLELVDEKKISSAKLSNEIFISYEDFPKNGFMKVIQGQAAQIFNNQEIRKSLMEMANLDLSGIINQIKFIAILMNNNWNLLKKEEIALFPNVQKYKDLTTWKALVELLDDLKNNGLDLNKLSERLNSAEVKNLSSYLLYQANAGNAEYAEFNLIIKKLKSALEFFIENKAIEIDKNDFNISLIPFDLLEMNTESDLITGNTKFRLETDIDNFKYNLKNNFDNMLQDFFLSEMLKVRGARNKSISTFDKDITRSMDIFLPGNVKVKNDPEVARDDLAKFVFQNQAAKYNELSAKDRVKLDVLLSLLSQEFEKALEFSCNLAIYGNTYDRLHFFMTDQASRQRIFSLDKSENDHITISYEGMCMAKLIQFPDFSQTELKENSRLRYMAKVKISNEDMERLSDLNWEYLNFENELDYKNNLTPILRSFLPKAFQFYPEIDIKVQFNMFS